MIDKHLFFVAADHYIGQPDIQRARVVASKIPLLKKDLASQEAAIDEMLREFENPGEMLLSARAQGPHSIVKGLHDRMVLWLAAQQEITGAGVKQYDEAEKMIDDLSKGPYEERGMVFALSRMHAQIERLHSLKARMREAGEILNRLEERLPNAIQPSSSILTDLSNLRTNLVKR